MLEADPNDYMLKNRGGSSGQQSSVQPAPMPEDILVVRRTEMTETLDSENISFHLPEESIERHILAECRNHGRY